MGTAINIILKYLFTAGFVFVLCSCTTISADWQEAERQGTIAAYEKYVQDYSHIEESALAKSRLENLRAEEAWKKAVAKNTVSGYQEFLHKYHNSRYAAKVQQKLKPWREKREWKSAKDKNTIEAFEMFLLMYPDSKFARVAVKNIIKDAKYYYKKIKRLPQHIPLTPAYMNIKKCNKAKNNSWYDPALNIALQKVSMNCGKGNSSQLINMGPSKILLIDTSFYSVITNSRKKSILKSGAKPISISKSMSKLHARPAAYIKKKGKVLIISQYKIYLFFNGAWHINKSRGH